jgi:hypothetical protein
MNQNPVFIHWFVSVAVIAKAYLKWSRGNVKQVLNPQTSNRINALYSNGETAHFCRLFMY